MKKSDKTAGIGVALSAGAMFITVINMIVSGFDGGFDGSQIALFCCMVAIFCSNLAIYSAEKKKTDDKNNEK
jgi:hypothetical protein